MKAGDLVRFHRNYTAVEPSLYGKLAMYLGERPIHRDDGVTVQNFEIHVLGEDVPRLCDKGIKSWLVVESESR